MKKQRIPCQKCKKIQERHKGYYVQVRQRNGYISKANFVLCDKCLKGILNEN